MAADWRSTCAQWVGLSNYDALLKDPGIRDAVVHTIVYTVLFVPISTALGLFLALGLNRRIRFIGIYRTAFLAPFIASVAAQGRTRSLTRSGCRARGSSETPTRRCS